VSQLGEMAIRIASAAMIFDAFDTVTIQTSRTSVFARWGGSGPPVLLLHGFPETHLMWRAVAPLLAREFTVVCPDLPGYGRSGCPASADDHAPYAKRAMARDLVEVMEQLGFTRFGLAGHDRGGRVAYRLALDHAERVRRLAVLDIVPTLDAWDLADARFAEGYWPWSLLAQPEPLPERLLAGAPDAVVDDALGGWGSIPEAFDPAVRAAYVAALSDPGHVHAICEEYRAAAALDREHDAGDRRAGRRIACPLLVLWSAGGPLGGWYTAAGGPLGLWRRWADDVRGEAVVAGHFFPEELPDQTAQRLHRFLALGVLAGTPSGAAAGSSLANVASDLDHDRRGNRGNHARDHAVIARGLRPGTRGRRRTSARRRGGRRLRRASRRARRACG
jgi:haloacetate dehalogenase